MAKHRRGRRKFRPYLKGIISFTMALGTLATKVVLSANVVDVLTEKAYVTSCKATYTLQQFVTGANVGPILCGVAHSDYTATEIEEWIENQGSWEQGDLRTQEIAKRKIRIIGVFKNPTGTNLTSVLQEGKMITTKLGWQLMTGQTLKFWVRNQGQADLPAGDPDFQIEGHANLWPN